MTQNDIEQATATELIVIGASAGGLQPLRTIAESLPAGLDAAVLVVVHVASTANSVLPQILARASALSVAHAADHDALEPGRILVAPPDRHLTVADGHVRVGRGPRENGHRPAIDPLFRSAAETYGARCCGVILSGTRDDGSAGLADIKRHGGVAIAQDPDEATYAGMPRNAIAATDVDRTLRAHEIGPELARLVAGAAERVSGNGAGGPRPAAASGELVALTCPECGGSLAEQDEGGVLRFRCHVGHAFSSRSMLAGHAEGVERAMWTAARSLEDRATLLRRLARNTDAAGARRSAEAFARSAVEAEEHAAAIRAAIATLDDAALGRAAAEAETEQAS